MQLKDQDGDVFYDKLHFKFIQMPLFKKTESELETRFDKWCYFLKNLESFDHIPAILKEPIFEKAFHTSEIGAMNKEEYDVYMKSLMSYMESKGMIDTALAEGIEIGRVEGRMEEKLEVVKNAIRLGMNDEEISLLTGLSVDEIKEIRKDL